LAIKKLSPAAQVGDFLYLYEIMIFSAGRMDRMSDRQLLEAYLETGRMDCFGELYNRYLPLVYGLCLRYLGDSAAAEDAVMEIFESLAPKMERAAVREFRTWLYSVARNHCLQILRRRKVEIAGDPPPVAVESDDFLHILEGGDQTALAALERCMDELPEPQRRSIAMFFLDEKSYADIVEATGYHLKSVKSYIQNGKRNLRNCLEAHNVTK
jgi:RNA polymerase sigma-70 factor (ECF subfamily)